MGSVVVTAIEVVDLVKTYGDLRAVDGVTLEVAEGEFVGILGPNGAGKTTLLEMIEGLRQPDSGTARVLGRGGVAAQPGAAAPDRRAAAGLVVLRAAHRPRADPHLRGAVRRPVATADEWLEQVGLVDKADTRVEDLSGGQAQRLSIACALVHDPEVLFLDEPTAALDPQARRNLWDLLSGLNDSGRTVVLTTHYMDEAEALCDRVAIMDHGRILRVRHAGRAGARPGRPCPDHRGARHARLETRARSPASTRRASPSTGSCSPPAAPPRWSPGSPRTTSSTAYACRPARSRTSSSPSPAGSTAHEAPRHSSPPPLRSSANNAAGTPKARVRPSGRSPSRSCAASCATRPRCSSRSSSR